MADVNDYIDCWDDDNEESLSIEAANTYATKVAEDALTAYITQSTQQGITPLFWRGWRPRRQYNFGDLGYDLDDFLSKIYDFEVQILKFFSPAAGLS